VTVLLYPSRPWGRSGESSQYACGCVMLDGGVGRAERAFALKAEATLDELFCCSSLVPRWARSISCSAGVRASNHPFGPGWSGQRHRGGELGADQVNDSVASSLSLSKIRPHRRWRADPLVGVRRTGRPGPGRSRQSGTDHGFTRGRNRPGQYSITMPCGVQWAPPNKPVRAWLRAAVVFPFRISDRPHIKP
jgi:hypothetical protein